MKNDSEQLDLLLVGHAVEDWIFEDGKEPRQQFGGIYNVNRSWNTIVKNRLGCRSKVRVEPSAYGHAFIKVDRENATKDVSANLNDRLREPTLVPSKWTHYCYLNELENLRFDPDNRGILSADVCAGKMLKGAYNFNYIFLSEDEHDPYKESICCSYGEGGNRTIFISHSPNMVRLWNSGKILWESKPIKQLKGVSVLGCGDNFAASFIFAKLYLHSHDEEAANFAIARCGEYLLYN